MKMIYKSLMGLTFFARYMIIFSVDINDWKRLVIDTAKGLV